MWKNIEFTKNKLEEMVEMTLENYGESESISHYDFVNHEYFANPFGDAIIQLAYDEEKQVLAGQYVINPRKYMFFGEEINAVLSLNTLTRKEYRGQKIFTGLADSGFEYASKHGYKFCYGAPNPNSHPGFIKKLQFSDLCEMPLFVRPLRFSRMIKENKNKFLGVLSFPFNLFSITKCVKDEKIIELTKENYRLMDDFWSSISDKYKIIGVRNAKYIKYRYLDVPRREYHPYVYVLDGKPVAFIVARIRKVANITTGMIADFLFVSGFEKQATKLAKFLSWKIKQLGANLAGCIMMKHSEEVKILKKAHFFKCPDKLLPQPTPLIIRAFDKELLDKGIMDVNNWFFTTGDYDVV